jgi:hypothetical protein
MSQSYGINSGLSGIYSVTEESVLATRLFLITKQSLLCWVTGGRDDVMSIASGLPQLCRHNKVRTRVCKCETPVNSQY